MTGSRRLGVVAVWLCSLALPTCSWGGKSFHYPYDASVASDGGKKQHHDDDDDSGKPTVKAPPCVQLTLLRNFKAPPSAELALFTVVDCDNKAPVANLPKTAFEIKEDTDDKLSSESESDFPKSQGRRVYISLLLDMSSSTRETLEQLIAGAKSFVSELLEKQKRQSEVYVGIELFDGADANTVWQLPIHDPKRLKDRLDELRTFAGSDPRSTNLYGAVGHAIASLQKRQQDVVELSDNGVASLGYMVLFTDGTDTAGLHPATYASTAVADANPATRHVDEGALPSVDTYAVALRSQDYDPKKLEALFHGKPTPSTTLCTDTCGRTNGICEDGMPAAGVPTGGASGTYSAVCAFGTDCTDCGPRAPGSTSTGGTSCSDSCAFAHNHHCDDGRMGSMNAVCSLGTDCTDCLEAPEPPTTDSHRIVEAENQDVLEQRFAELATKIAGQLEGTYLLAYCSPKRRGRHMLHLRVSDATDPRSTAIQVEFDATGFMAGCTADLFHSACNGKGCGGINCGACDDETQSCNAATDQCVDACLAANHCDGMIYTNALGFKQTCAFGKEHTQCGSQCVDINSDSHNCDECGNACLEGASCVAGACKCEGSKTECSSGCFDLQRDALHCGSCTNPCPAGVTCSAGACDCGKGRSACSGNCVDTSTDATNCGGCGVVCSSGTTCMGGACVCSNTSATACTSVADAYSCFDLQFSPQHCGECNRWCGSGGSCNMGVCVCAGGTSSMSCGGTCADVTTDPSNCGTCSHKCAPDQACTASQCQAGPFSTCSSDSLSGSFPFTYSGMLADAVSTSCFGSRTGKALQFIAPKTGNYMFSVDDSTLRIEVQTGTCSSRVPPQCTDITKPVRQLQAGSAVLLNVVSSTGASTSTPFKLTVKTDNK